MKFKRIKIISTLIGLVILIGLTASWVIGSYLISAKHITLPNPGFENLQNVEFVTSDGINIKGWYVALENSKVTCILLHGFRGNKFDMVERAKFLLSNGYSVLLIDFRGNGESGGEYTTSGFIEINEVKSAVNFVKIKNGGKIIVIGNSMGAAALSMAKVDNIVKGMVFEQMYSNLDTAIKNRIAAVMGEYSKIFSPLLTCQMKIRFGFSVDDVAPIDFVKNIECPKLFMVADKDNKTTINESMNMFNCAKDSKELVIFAGAKHQDLYNYDKNKYEMHLLEFIKKFAQQGDAPETGSSE